MSRLFPYPLLWTFLVAFWLLLNQSLEPGQWLLAIVLATLCCWAVANLQPPKSRLRNLPAIFKLLGLVLIDVLRSNLSVFLLVLRGGDLRSKIVTVPLELRDPNGLAVLSTIVTAVPGSAWLSYDSGASTAQIHILDVDDDVAWVATIKRQYESLLLEIFE